MGRYLNQGNENFQKSINSEIYVDKTGLLAYTNRGMNTLQGYVCISRPRRFSKSMAANMLTAYYSRGCDSKKFFEGLQISKSDDFEKYRNKYNTISLNMQEFLSRSDNVEDLIDRVEKLVLRDIKKEYPQVDYFDEEDLTESMQDVYVEEKCPFVIIIDEWDCIFREFRHDKEAQEKYLDFLRNLLKDKAYIHLAYMTGILPMKKYGTHSVLNMFDEFSMIYPGPLASYVGFTEREVENLCKEYKMEIEEVKTWYDGYTFSLDLSIYSPRSVVNRMLFGKIENYWNQTETNDMTTFRNEDDVLTLLIHLGYLAYDSDNKTVRIPNNEVRTEYVNSVSASDWGRNIESVKRVCGYFAGYLERKRRASCGRNSYGAF